MCMKDQWKNVELGNKVMLSNSDETGNLMRCTLFGGLSFMMCRANTGNTV